MSHFPNHFNLEKKIMNHLEQIYLMAHSSINLDEFERKLNRSGYDALSLNEKLHPKTSILLTQTQEQIAVVLNPECH